MGFGGRRDAAWTMMPIVESALPSFPTINFHFLNVSFMIVFYGIAST